MISRIRLVSLLVSIIVILSISPEAGSQSLGYYCRNNTYNPNVNRTYRANLNILLSTLSDASRTEDFQRSTAGLNTSEPTFGLYMCRGDVTGDLCHSCMENASTDILKSCPDQTAAIIWYDNCMLRYSNRSISVQNRSIILSMYNTGNVTGVLPDGFYRALKGMLENIATRAANDLSGKKFAIQQGNFSLFGILYALGQCTPDLKAEGCYRCLKDAILVMTKCCDDFRRVVRVLYPSCNMRYESYKFYNITADLAPAAPPPNGTGTPPAITIGKGKRQSVATIIAIVVSIIVSIVLFVLAFLFLKNRSKEPYGVVDDEADFGMARIFEVDQSKGETSRIAGTYGYMSPEYVMHGQFSVKSDVYSFGVLVLEIISGKKNSHFYRLDLGEGSLLSYAWKNWRDGTPLALLDDQLGDSNNSRNEILHYIHVGLLCVQEDVEQRPTMASVVLMLSSRSTTLAAPSHPAFFAHNSTTIKLVVPTSVNETLITELYPR